MLRTVIKSEIETVTNAPFFTVIGAAVLRSLLCLSHYIFSTLEMFQTKVTYINDTSIFHVRFVITLGKFVCTQQTEFSAVSHEKKMMKPI
jgi:hypothetical protein